MCFAEKLIWVWALSIFQVVMSGCESSAFYLTPQLYPVIVALSTNEPSGLGV
jgi:hypothetical protein